MRSWKPPRTHRVKGESSFSTQRLSWGPFSSIMRWKTGGLMSVRRIRWSNSKIDPSMRDFQEMSSFPLSSSHLASTQAMVILWACLSSSVNSIGLIWSFQRRMLAAPKINSINAWSSD